MKNFVTILLANPFLLKIFYKIFLQPSHPITIGNPTSYSRKKITFFTILPKVSILLLWIMLLQKLEL